MIIHKNLPVPTVWPAEVLFLLSFFTPFFFLRINSSIPTGVSVCGATASLLTNESNFGSLLVGSYVFPEKTI